MNQALIDENKKKLLAEQKRIEAVFKHDDNNDSEVAGGHVPKFSEAGTEQTENASEVEQFVNDLSVTSDLEGRLAKVKAALGRIEAGTYGKCSVGGEQISEARLRAEPAADTCVEHAK